MWVKEAVDAENGTNAGPSDFSERTMREVFFYPFRQAVEKAQIGAIMPSYSENDGGIPSHANLWLLKDMLRKEWGFQPGDTRPSEIIEHSHRGPVGRATPALMETPSVVFQAELFSTGRVNSVCFSCTRSVRKRLPFGTKWLLF